MQVVKPEPHHVHDFVSLIERFLSEGIDGYKFGLRQEDVETTFFLWVNRELPLLLLEHEGNVVGCLGGNLSPHWFDYTTIIFNEMIWYVLPEHRKSGGGLMLIRAMEKHCKKINVVKMSMGHTHSVMPEELRKLFFGCGIGYVLAGHLAFLKAFGKASTMSVAIKLTWPIFPAAMSPARP